MTWFRENRFLGSLLVALALCTLGALYFVFSAKGSFETASADLQSTATELNRLQSLKPFPNEGNLQKLKTHADEYAAALTSLKEQLKSRVLAAPPLQPNEFQARLRETITAVTAKAQQPNPKVALPENFNLGFDQYIGALPVTDAAAPLGQQLAQIELLMNLLIDARVDAVTLFRRTALPEERAAQPTPSPSPSAGRKPSVAPPPAVNLVQRNSVEIAFTSSPAAARKVLNQIAAAPQQFFIVRTLHVRNERDKGPPRDAGAGAGAGTKPGDTSGLNFIVGTERIQTAAMIELVKFNF